MTSARIRATLVRMRMVSAVAMATFLVLAGCSGDSGDEAAFEGDPIEGGATAGSVTPDTTEPEGDSEGDDPGRITLDPDALLEELTTETTLVQDDPSTSAITEPGGNEATLFRASLAQGGLPDDQIDCFVASTSEALGMSETEMDRLIVDDPANGWLVAASQAAASDCLPGGLPSEVSGGGVVLPEGAGGTLTEQLAGLGMTSAEADCISELYADTSTAAENKDFLGCIPLERIVELAG